MAQKIKQIHIFGMQCSGTNHLEKTLILNLPIDTVYVKGNLLGWKHDDIWSPSGFANEDNSAIDYDEREHHSMIYNSLFIVIYRNPIAWLRSLHLTPHNAPKLHGLDFSTFIRSPFETFFTPMGKDIPESEDELAQIARPDRFWERYPSALAMRKTKIDIFESFKYRLPNVCYINLETFIENPQAVLAALTDHYGITFNKDLILNSEDKHGKKHYAPKQYAHIPLYDLAHLARKINFDYEKNIGYSLIPSNRSFKVGQVFTLPKDPSKIFKHRPIMRAYSHDRGDKLFDLSLRPVRLIQ